MKTVITGDIHARWEKSRKLFSDVGMITLGAEPTFDTRNEGFHHIQLGDSASLGYDIVELPFLQWLFGVVGVDEALIGNHELPAVHFDPFCESNLFEGWETKEEWSAREEARALARGLAYHDTKPYKYEVGRDPHATSYVQALYRQGRYKAATHVGKWLVTHAGVMPSFQKNLHYRGVEAALIAEDLNGRFERVQRLACQDPIITGERFHNHSIFWVRFHNMINGYQRPDRSKVQVPQVIGHTGAFGPQLHGDRLWNIDTPHADESRESAGVACLVTEDEGETFELHYAP